MTRSQLLLLLVPPAALCLLGLATVRLAHDMSVRSGADSVVELLERGLDEPSKLTTGHVRTVLGAARTIEALGARASAATAASVAGVGRGCILLAVLDLVLVLAVFRVVRGRLGSSSPPAEGIPEAGAGSRPHREKIPSPNS